MKKKHMVHPLYLHPQEQKLFEKLPAKVREGWEVRLEKLEAYETPRQLEIRREIFRQKDPKFQKLIADMQKLQKGDSLEKLGSIPKPMMLSLLFTMGAVYLRGCIESILPTMKKDEDVSGLAALSGLRHYVLQANSKVID